MEAESLRRARVDQLLDLAATYKGLNRRQLADALGRDQTKLSPASGNPKLDYLVRLAEILDWPIGNVADAIWERAGLPATERGLGGSFDHWNDLARKSHREGDFRGMIDAARRMWSCAATPQQRALSMLRESGGWDGLGRYAQELDVLRRGLAESPIDRDTSTLLTANLANTYFTLGHLVEGRSIARDLAERLEAARPVERAPRAALAFSRYVMGNAGRSLAGHDSANAQFHASEAIRAYEASSWLYLTLADEFGNDAWRGIAGTCAGGILACEVDLGQRSPDSAVEELTDGLGAVIDASDGLVGDRLESYGWWCVFGCEVAIRHMHGRDLAKAVAIFTNKGYEIADRLDNWAMRERLFTLEYVQRHRAAEDGDPDSDWSIDQEEVKVIVGTMGRFPMFRSTGWRILQTATVVDER
ncbi:MAG: hypothetical protein KF787_06355 [Phycisphaeraceae bacterium]|nr:hypothetical protein [Phycisphaerae bacterium]MBX3392253.1 hypothetical protein [Phycisphaeraceae bacterium]HRJ49670.1 hypothetical protein [Phycisphaerales bacterium]